MLLELRLSDNFDKSQKIEGELERVIGIILPK